MKSRPHWPCKTRICQTSVSTGRQNFHMCQNNKRKPVVKLQLGTKQGPSVLFLHDRKYIFMSVGFEAELFLGPGEKNPPYTHSLFNHSSIHPSIHLIHTYTHSCSFIPSRPSSSFLLISQVQR